MAIFRAFQGISKKKHCTVLGVDHGAPVVETDGLYKKMNKAKLGESPNNPTIRVFHELHVAVRRHCQSHMVRGLAGYGRSVPSLARDLRTALRAAFAYSDAIASNRSKICTFRQLPSVPPGYAFLSAGAASRVHGMCFCVADRSYSAMSDGDGARFAMASGAVECNKGRLQSWTMRWHAAVGMQGSGLRAWRSFRAVARDDVNTLDYPVRWRWAAKPAVRFGACRAGRGCRFQKT